MVQLGLGTKTAFGIGQIAEGAKNGAFNIFLLFYFTAVLGLPGSLAGAALLIATTFDAVTDPLAGALSDRLRHRWGRRHPFMYASAVPLGITFALLFRPPAGLGTMGLFAWLTTFTVLVRASMTLYHVPHLALGAELSRDYTERTSIVAFRTFFGLVGTALVVVFGWGVFFRPTQAFANGQASQDGRGGRRAKPSELAVAVGEQDAVVDGDAHQQHHADEGPLGKIGLRPEKAHRHADSRHRHAQEHHQRKVPGLKHRRCDEKDEEDRPQKHPAKGFLYFLCEKRVFTTLDLIAGGYRKALERSF